jgi:pyruvate/2-oxoglutarate dehydrogenase complex dihydrolipoamide dehydrogenase (E3) component
MAKFDAIVIGTGPAGEHCLGRLSDSGMKVAAVERELVAGECSYWACMPSKTLLRPGDVIAEARRAPGAAEAISGDLNLPAALGWRDFIISDLDDTEHAAWVEEKATLLRGAAKLAGPGKIEVDGEPHESERIVIATGSSAAFPPIDGLADLDGVWTNREATNVEEIPGRLLILGGGPVGCELGQAFARMGSSVVIVEGADHLLPNVPRAAGEAVGECLEAEGIELRLGDHASAAERHGDKYRLVFDGADNAEGDKLLVATGRKARIEDLGLETIGIEADEKGIPVDETLRAAEGVWAIGDVTPYPRFTHVGKYQARIVVGNINGEQVRADYRAVPKVVFTDPEVAFVGEAEGKATGTGELKNVSRTSTYEREWDKRRMFVTVVSDGAKLTGAYAVGPSAGEWLQQATLAIRAELPLDILRDTIQPFPTFSEAFFNALDDLD